MKAAPAVVIAAPASGSGKTTVATGLIGALCRAGHRVAPFKVGPDFIDPGYHALAAGRPGRNLDPVLVGADLIGPLYRHGSRDTDIAVVEGVMGLFDGRIEEPFRIPASGSTGEVAQMLGAPVIMVVDGRGQSQSIAAVLHGFSTLGHGVRVAGVILNRVGSPRHEQVLRQACESVGVPVLGALPRRDELAVPSRHLGLVTAAEYGDAQAAVAAITDLVTHHVDLSAVHALAASTVTAAPWSPHDAVGEPVAGQHVIALAAGRAFAFGYAEQDELLRAAGAQVATFDPLSETLPSRSTALVLPGGFPEQYPQELSANTVVRNQIRALAERSAPVHAECGGLTYLMTDLDGHPMCGVLPGSARFTQRLTLGYRDAVAASDSALFMAGQRVTAHEFHRTTVEFSEDVQPAWLMRDSGGERASDGVIRAGVHASYLHTHPAARPSSIARFVQQAARVQA